MKRGDVCLRGHPFDAANTLLVSRGNGKMKRCCRACARLRAAERYQVNGRVARALARAERIEEWKREISPADLAWAAGHFEGEGTISISSESRNGYARPLASLASTDRAVIDLFCGWWPTSIAGKNPRVPTPNARAVYRWEINSAIKVRAFIDQIAPHLRTERCRLKFAVVSEFVDLVLSPHAGKRRPRHPEYIDAIRRLNHRGSAPYIPNSMLPSGQTVLERIQSDNLLPAPKGEA